MAAKASRYHHGALREALLEATMELVREKGAKNFSAAEAARRVGVSITAPYRHFADRDGMIAAVATLGFADLAAALRALPRAADLPRQAADFAAAYLGFAQADPARFEVMFAAGLDKSRHPELLLEAGRAQGAFEETLEVFLEDDAVGVAQRSAELWALIHGVVVLEREGHLTYVVPAERVDAVAQSAARTWAIGVGR